MRANRKGFVCVLANWSYVYHVGEESFGLLEKGRSERDRLNSALLADRYPEYFPATERYFSSAEARARRLVEHYPLHKELAIDLRDMPVLPNGTNMLARALVPELVKVFGPSRCAVIASVDQFSLLGLPLSAGVDRWDSDSASRARLGLRMAQPYKLTSLALLANTCARIGVFMLDTISQDCLYLQKEAVQLMWEWVAFHSDVIFFNSPYTEFKFRNRYHVSPAAKLVSSYHSLNLAEYRNSNGDIDTAGDVEDYVLLIGNHFQHKNIHAAVSVLCHLQAKLYVIGAEITGIDATCFRSGSLSDAEFSTLLSGALAIVIPSLYEGFGFPFLEAVSASRPVVVFDSPLNRALWDEIGSPANVRFFESHHGLFTSVTEALRTPPDGKIVPRSDSGWNRSAREIVVALESIRHVPKLRSIKQRLTSMDLLFDAVSVK